MTAQCAFSLRLPDPAQDVIQKESFIFWGSCVDSDPKISETILQQINRFDVTLGALQVCKKSPEPQWKVIKAVFQHLYQKSLLWRELARWVGIIAFGILGIGATLYVKHHLTHRYEQMRSGTLYFYQATDLSRSNPVKKYTQLDFNTESTLGGLGLCVVYAIPALLLRSKAEDSFLSVYQRLNQMNQHPYYMFQELIVD